MHIIPAINCPDLDCAIEKVRIAEKFFPFGDGWVHLDVADARFTPNRTWGDPSGWRKLQTSLNLEVHLMVEDPEIRVEEWFQAGAKRVIVHVETLREEELAYALANQYGAEAMLAISPETPVESLKLYFEKFSAFQVLAVHPGLAGQKFLPLVLDKVRFLREYYHTATIEVDGGIDLETARGAREAGADIIVSASYIFNAANPAQAYAMLSSIE